MAAILPNGPQVRFWKMTATRAEPKISSGLSRFLTFDARCQQSHFSNLRKGLEIADSSGESSLQARPQMNVFLYRSLPGIFLA